MGVDMSNPYADAPCSGRRCTLPHEHNAEYHAWIHADSADRALLKQWVKAWRDYERNPWGGPAELEKLATLTRHVLGDS